MEKELLDSLGSLKEALHGDPRVRTLDELEAKVNASPEVRALSSKLSSLEKDYEDLLVYKKESDPEAREAQKKLYEAKKELDENPLVQSYNAAYVAVRDLYMAVDDVIYAPFRKKSFVLEDHQ